MSWTLRPTYFKQNGPSFFSTPSDIFYFYTHTGVRTNDYGVRFAFENYHYDSNLVPVCIATFYYETDGSLLENIQTKIKFTSAASEFGDFERLVNVTPYIVDTNFNKIGEYAAKKSAAYYSYDDKNEPYSFNFNFSGSHLFNNERLALEIVFPLDDHTYFGGIAFYSPPIIYASGTGIITASSNAYTPKELSTAISDLYRSAKKETNTLNYSPSGVLFFDYDGKILDSYTPDAFLRLHSMPENPVHPGLISRGWNWSIERAQEYVRRYGNLDIGQMYSTADGKTRIYINIATTDLLDYKVPIYAKGLVTIDWGDGKSSEYSVTSGKTIDTGYIFNAYLRETTFMENGLYDCWELVARHVYEKSGHYVITIDVADIGEIEGKIIFVDELVDTLPFDHYLYATDDEPNPFYYKIAVEGIEIGNNVLIGDYAFYCYTNLSSLLIPYDCEVIGEMAFFTCDALYALVIPSSLKTLSAHIVDRCSNLIFISLPESLEEIGSNALTELDDLIHITIPDSIEKIDDHDDALGVISWAFHLSYIVLPDTITYLNQGMFYNCCSLTSIALPLHLTKIGANAFENCSSLRRIELVETITEIDQSAFKDCSSLSYVVTPSSISIISESLFEGCEKLETVVINNGPTEIRDRAFFNCKSLSNITLPSSLEHIGNQVFFGCSGLHDITIPESVQTIGESVFEDYSLKRIVFKGSTPPSLAEHSPFSQGLASGCVIYVPRGSLSTYTSTLKYPDPRTYTYIEYDDISELPNDEIIAYVQNDILMLSGPGVSISDDVLTIQAMDAYFDNTYKELRFAGFDSNEQETGEDA